MNAEILEGSTWEPLVAITMGGTRLLLDGGSGYSMIDPMGKKSAPAACSDFDWAIFG